MSDTKNENLGCGIFLVLVGAVIMAKRLGWIPWDAEWLLPAAFITIGLSIILKAIR